LPENFPALSPGLWMCDGSAGNPSGDFFSLLLLADIALRFTNQNYPRSCTVYNTGTRYIFSQIKGVATFLCYWHFLSPFFDA
jgi:hypothetical protein